MKRRQFLVGACATASMLALRNVLSTPLKVTDENNNTAFGALQPDPQQHLDLPPGFTYRIVSQVGNEMDDGLLVPGWHDGMAAFPGDNGRIILVCNHELLPDWTHLGAFGQRNERLTKTVTEKLYDPGNGLPGLGGTTTTIYNPSTQKTEQQYLSLAGTELNCAGGPTPWHSWLSCEETVSRQDANHTRDHGWVFDVPAGRKKLIKPEPLTALGRFKHEAAGVDPATGIVYMTEDWPDGLFYRFVPDQKNNLQSGRLQALAIREQAGLDTRNWRRAGPTLQVGESMQTYWIDLAHTDSPDDDLRYRGNAVGAAIFARGEGLWFGQNELYFACTIGGPSGAGQVFRYRPGPHEGTPRETETPGVLELFVESRQPRQLSHCDNVTVTPRGDVLLCEDNGRGSSLVGVTQGGELYRLARNAYTHSELAGACFSPDGKILFVNIQDPGMTLAITGPFPA